jgi:hypothetical protein
MKKLIKSGLRLTVVMAAAFGLIAASLAADVRTGKGGAADLLSKPIRTVTDIEALKPGDTIAMACPKCKTVHVTRLTKEFKGNVTQALPGEKHLCPGCENTFEVKGHGKGKNEAVVHKCNACGSKNAFCCVVKEGSGPTKGMVEHKK